MSTKNLLTAVLLELQKIHFHIDRMEVFYKMVNNIKEDEKTGAWIEQPQKKKNEKRH